MQRAFKLTSKSELYAIFYALKKNKPAIISLGVIIILCLTAVLADFLAPRDPTEQNLDYRLKPPNTDYLLGTDELGRCILSRIIYGSRVSLIVGIISVSVSLGIGITVGCIAGYFGGKIGTILMTLVDITLSFPGLVLAIGFAALLGPGINNVMLALSLVGWPPYARVIRGETLALREKQFISASKAIGESGLYIVLHHIIPNIISAAIVMATLGMGWAIISEAGLSFIGLGIAPPESSWGLMISTGRLYFLYSPHTIIFPCLFLSLTILSFNILGDGLRDALDPRLRIR